MRQQYKNIYFADYPSESSQGKNLTLAFGSKDADLYESVRTLSSHELRELIGHPAFAALQYAAQEDGLAINTYCLRVLRQKKRSLNEAPVEYRVSSLSRETMPLVEPLQATFRGGQAEPLHTWYPFLEGYSPQFVEQVLHEFAPSAGRILDPFSGTGTTPLTVSRLGRDAFYSELNPLLQYLTHVKAIALTADQMTRQQLASLLRLKATTLDEFLLESSPDGELRSAYSQVFGESRFFDDDTFEQVLRARSALDYLACTEPLAAKFITVAVLSSLILGSRLIRRGDLRFKTDSELKRETEAFGVLIRNRLITMSDDLERLTPLSKRPILVSEDSRKLANLPSLDIEAVVTSPPYLNGTNYFRNTKVELWFLRCLRSATDLAGFRYKAVTAGINDVTVNKANPGLHPSVEEIVERLAACAYDRRIPQMIAAYFADMQAVFAALKVHLVADAKVLIDIGDSSYSDIHVPTDQLLVDVLAAQGFSLEREVVLRKRMSRSGFPLRQVLLVFQLPKSRIRTAKDALGVIRPQWAAAWTKFKIELPHQQGDFAKRNWGHPLHSLCSYQGKMKPSLASYLVNTFAPSGGKFLDPFAGVGTIPFEAALHGLQTWGFDISPAAWQIANAKLGRPDYQECESLLGHLDAYIRCNQSTDAEIASAQLIRFNGDLPSYFDKKTFNEILLARRYFLEHPARTPEASLVMASLLHILHGNRPYALSRRSHPITPFAPSGPAEYRPLISHLRDKVNRSLAVVYPDEFVPGRMLFQDATGWWPQEIDRLDAIITSPPFFDSTRFYLANWMRLWFCGWEAPDFRTQPLAFVDERQKTGFEIYEPIFRQARERLKPGGVMVLHLGKSRKCDMAQSLSRFAMRWFRVFDVFSESVSHCESHGIRDKGTVKEHQYLVLY